MPRMHADELDLDEELVRALLREQFPDWAELPLVRIEPAGTDNAIFRLGDRLAVRLPRVHGPEVEEDSEHEWLPILARALPVEIPLPVARGRPGRGYPWHWSVVTWLDGEIPIEAPLAVDELASFVAALRTIDPAGGPPPGARRGEPLATRDAWVRDALERVDAPGAIELWELAAAAPEWDGPPVWLHADLDARNVLVRGGRLTGVIDWGCAGVGDPAVDVMAAWKLLRRDDRERFRATLDVDEATWLRAKGWCLSQALIALGYYTLETNPTLVREAKRWLAEVLAS